MRITKGTVFTISVNGPAKGVHVGHFCALRDFEDQELFKGLSGKVRLPDILEQAGLIEQLPEGTMVQDGLLNIDIKAEVVK